jgi:hypothetical protein
LSQPQDWLGSEIASRNLDDLRVPSDVINGLTFLMRIPVSPQRCLLTIVDDPSHILFGKFHTVSVTSLKERIDDLIYLKLWE